MALIGREIVQSRTWEDPRKMPPPNLNYVETFPITVLEAVRSSMEEKDSQTLKELLDIIFRSLENKQPIFAARPANYLMTFAGTAGEVGAIRISKEIPWDPTKRSHDKIPTEKAVADLMMKLGLLDKDGNVIEGDGLKIRWTDIIGRPMVYDEEGYNEGGVITQKAVTDSLNRLRNQIQLQDDNNSNKFHIMTKRIDDHLYDKNNPHSVTIEQLGALAKTVFETHLETDNPHQITKYHLDLDKVDNTSDDDKPVSKEQREAITLVEELLKELLNKFIAETVNSNFIKTGKYTRESGQLVLTHDDETTTVLNIPINGLLYRGDYDNGTKEFLLTTLGGGVQKIPLKDLFIRYLGSTGSEINIEIDGDQETGYQIIRATLNNNSITGDFFASNSIPERAYKEGSISTRALGDLVITTVKIADGAITTEKIKEFTITTSRLADRAVDGRTLFSSGFDNRVLSVLDAGDDPIWTLINAEMMGPSSVNTEALSNDSVTTSKLKDNIILNSKIYDMAVDGRTIASLAITNEKIANKTIQGIKFVDDIFLPGTPRIGTRPSIDSNTNQIPDTRWVKDRLLEVTLRTENLPDRIVDGRILFSSNTDNRVLLVTTRESNPIWGQVNREMIANSSIDTDHYIDRSITADALADSLLKTRHFSNQTIMRDHIKDNAIDTSKLFPSTTANRVLAVTTAETNPIYTQVNRGMIANNAIDGDKIEDNAIPPRKLSSDKDGSVVLSVQSANTDPLWTKIRTQMISDRQINGRVLFTSPISNRVLTVTPEHGDDPSWTQINGLMIREREIGRLHIKEKSIVTEHLEEKLIDSSHIKDWSIKSNNIESRAITGVELFTTAQPDRVLAVAGTPYSDPQWMQINQEMIEDEAVVRTKIFKSDLPYRVLGATNPNAPPEYLMITKDFIVDDTITPQKLVHNFVLFGTPESTVRAPANSNNRMLADTRWVRETIASTMKDFNPEILFDTIDSSMIQEKSILPKHLFSSDIGMRLLGVTYPGKDLEFLLVEEEMIANGSITNNKLGRNLTFMGQPKVEIRPSPNAGDHEGSGTLIPDVQWVRDRIAEAGIGGGGSGSGGSGQKISYSKDIPENPQPGDEWIGSIEDPDSLSDIVIDSDECSGSGVIESNSITNQMLMDRIVTGSKLFTSSQPNRVLGVLSANSDPEYLIINREMIEDRIIDVRKMMVSPTANRLLGAKTAHTDLEFVTINQQMLDDNIISLSKMRTDSVGTPQLLNESVTKEKLANAALIESFQLFDNSVSRQKIQDGAIDTIKLKDSAITTIKLQDRSITSIKLEEEIQLPLYSTVPSTPNYERRAIRNTILSRNDPTDDDGEDGDIWFKYRG